MQKRRVLSVERQECRLVAPRQERSDHGPVLAFVHGFVSALRVWTISSIHFSFPSWYHVQRDVIRSGPSKRKIALSMWPRSRVGMFPPSTNVNTTVHPSSSNSVASRRG